MIATSLLDFARVRYTRVMERNTQGNTQIAELQASIRELEAELPGADAAMRAILEQQIANMRGVIGSLSQLEPALAAEKQRRPSLRSEVAAFFRPEQPPALPAWIPDTITRGEVTPALMACPPGAQIYTDDSSISCAFPGERGVSLSVAHGLTLHFNAEARLRSQRFYDRGLLRWSIEYYATGGREAEGYFTSTEPKTYLEHGLHTRYAPNGVITSQSYWRDGARHGWTKVWEDDGYPIGATLYVEGREVQRVHPDGSRG